MEKITRRILGCICMSPVIVGLLYGIYELVLLAINDPAPTWRVLSVCIPAIVIFGLFVFGVDIISE